MRYLRSLFFDLVGSDPKSLVRSLRERFERLALDVRVSVNRRGQFKWVALESSSLVWGVKRALRVTSSFLRFRLRTARWVRLLGWAVAVLGG